MRYTLVALAMTVVTGLSGCASMVMPYSDTPLCKKGAAAGYCGSITEVYEETLRDVRQDLPGRKKPKACVSGACAEDKSIAR